MAVNMVVAEPVYINMGFEQTEQEGRPPPFNPEVVGETPQYVIESVAPPPFRPKSLKKKCKNYTVTAVIILLVLLSCAGILLAYYLLSPCGGHAVWCGDGSCVKQEEWCDGTVQCLNGKDEASCVRLSGTGFLLQVFSRRGQAWRSVCGDDWNDDYGRQVCEHIGYSRETYVSSGQTPLGSSGSQGFMRLSSNANPDASLLANFLYSDTCPSGKTVTLRCIACGSKPASGERIVGGQQPSPGEWPWQVVLRERSKFTKCGGSIIAPYWILTSAQCAQRTPDPLLWEVYVDIHAELLLFFVPAEKVTRIITFPEYDNKTHNNDIALMKLQKPLQMSGSSRPICLPNLDMDFTPPQPSWIVGFGRTSEGGDTSSVLKEAQVSLISTAECNGTNMYDGQITHSMICAGQPNGGVDRCEGDEGGPLMTEKDSVWWIMGDISWGEGCGRVNKPGVYGNVTYFLDWIYVQMKLHRDD
ncbi:transmembrane protease serine 2-like [Clupea harengus]|uniref:Transmembrane protease serine 2-like n=1 Tax=Clupea harengus TaxID=7950 RepID=A0A6P8G2S3_CLUHA|nr:transmembrane protease serine 2-like [Clupea harengus]